MGRNLTLFDSVDLDDSGSDRRNFDIVVGIVHFFDPFDFLLTTLAFSEVASLYPEHLRERLGATLVPLGCDATAKLVRSVPPSESLLDFLWVLNRAVHECYRVVVREWGDPWPPAQTLAVGCGACRDLAVVFIEACRRVGIAARFASGFVGATRAGIPTFSTPGPRPTFPVSDGAASILLMASP